MADLTFNFVYVLTDLGGGQYQITAEFGGGPYTFVDKGVNTLDSTIELEDNLDFEGSGNLFQYKGESTDGILVNDDGSQFYLFSDNVLPVDGSFTFTATSTTFVFCFTHGALIETEDGPVAVEALTAGDRVRTLDNGFQPLRWIGRTTVSAEQLAIQPDLRPVRIAAGALGNAHDLVVSPAHRMLIDGWRAQTLFGKAEVLVAARDLVNDTTITIESASAGAAYFCLLFDRHELVQSAGCWSESLNPTRAAIDAMDAASRAELGRLFPDLATATTDWKTARPPLSRREARLI